MAGPQQCTWLIPFVLSGMMVTRRCKRLCRWPSKVCGIHIREREKIQQQELERLLPTVRKSARVPHGFGLYSTSMQLNWVLSNQKKEKKR